MDINRCRFQDFEVAGKHIVLFPDVIKRVGKALGEEHRYGHMLTSRKLSMSELRSLKRGRQVKLEIMSDTTRSFAEPLTPQNTRRTRSGSRSNLRPRKVAKKEETTSGSDLERRTPRPQSVTSRGRSDPSPSPLRFTEKLEADSVGDAEALSSSPLPAAEMDTSGTGTIGKTQSNSQVTFENGEFSITQSAALLSNGMSGAAVNAYSERQPGSNAALTNGSTSTPQLSAHLLNGPTLPGTRGNGYRERRSSSHATSTMVNPSPVQFSSVPSTVSTAPGAVSYEHGEPPSSQPTAVPNKYVHFPRLSPKGAVFSWLQAVTGPRNKPSAPGVNIFPVTGVAGKGPNEARSSSSAASVNGYPSTPQSSRYHPNRTPAGEPNGSSTTRASTKTAQSSTERSQSSTHRSSGTIYTATQSLGRPLTRPSYSLMPRDMEEHRSDQRAKLSSALSGLSSIAATARKYSPAMSSFHRSDETVRAEMIIVAPTAENIPIISEADARESREIVVHEDNLKWMANLYTRPKNLSLLRAFKALARQDALVASTAAAAPEDDDVITISDDENEPVAAVALTSVADEIPESKIAASISSVNENDKIREFEESAKEDTVYFNSIGEKAKVQVRTRSPTPVTRVVTPTSTVIVTDDHQSTSSQSIFKEKEEMEMPAASVQAPSQKQLNATKTKKRTKKRKRETSPDYTKVAVSTIQSTVPVRSFRTRYQERKEKADAERMQKQLINDKCLERQIVMREIMASLYGIDDKVIKFINFSKWNKSSPTRRICPKCQGRWFKVVKYWEPNETEKDWAPALVCYGFPCNGLVWKNTNVAPVGAQFGAPTKRALEFGIDDFWNYTAEHDITNWTYQIFARSYCKDLNEWRLGPFYNMILATHGMSPVVGQEKLTYAVAPSLPVDYWKKPKMYKGPKDHGSNRNITDDDLRRMTIFERRELVQPPDDWAEWVIPGFDISNGTTKKTKSMFFNTALPKQPPVEQLRPDPMPACSSKTPWK